MEVARVARMHALIEATSRDDLTLIDLGAASGTMLNGTKISNAPLRIGDQSVVGQSRIDVLDVL